MKKNFPLNKWTLTNGEIKMKNLVFGLVLLSSLTAMGAPLTTNSLRPTNDLVDVTAVATGGGLITYSVKAFADKERNVTCYVAYGEITEAIKRDGAGGAGLIAIGNPNISCIKN